VNRIAAPNISGLSPGRDVVSGSARNLGQDYPWSKVSFPSGVRGGGPDAQRRQHVDLPVPLARCELLPLREALLGDLGSFVKPRVVRRSRTGVRRYLVKRAMLVGRTECNCGGVDRADTRKTSGGGYRRSTIVASVATFLAGVCKELHERFDIDHATLQIDPPAPSPCALAPDEIV